MPRKKSRKYNLHSVLIFFVTLNILAIPLYIVVFTNFSFEPLKEINARLLYLTLKLLGHDVTIDGSALQLSTESGIQNIQVSWDSTGWKSMYALFSLVMATPVSRISKRLKFALIGVGLIFMLNYLRISTTIVASIAFGFNLFDIVHGFLWREGMILGVIAIWFLWIRREKYNIAEIK